MADDILVKVDGVSKKFCRRLRQSLWYGLRDMASEVVGGKGHHDELRDGEFWAVKDVSFELRRGECLGLLGRNGAGKTTLLKMLNGLIKPDHGRIEMRGRVGALIALGAGFNPILTGRENIYVNGSILGLTTREIDEKLEEIIDFAEIQDFIDSPVQSYSSGMQVRLGFSVATALNPEILLVDEVLAVGDFRFRWKCLERIKKIKNQGVSILLVSHNAPDLMRTCTHGIVLQKGETKFQGDISQAVLGYEGTPETAEGSSDSAPLAPLRNKIKFTGIRFQVQNSEGTVMKSGDRVDIEMGIDSTIHLSKARVIVGLFHAQFGALFYLSSYLDNQWIELKPGHNLITLSLEQLPVQYGSYYAEASIRGPELGDTYDLIRSESPLVVTEPVPNYEGFGINGILMPKSKWRIA